MLWQRRAFLLKSCFGAAGGKEERTCRCRRRRNIDNMDAYLMEKEGKLYEQKIEKRLNWI